MSTFTMDFDALVSFHPNITQAPTQNELFQVMQAREDDYADYIRNYVWIAGKSDVFHSDVFYDVESVWFSVEAI